MNGFLWFIGERERKKGREGGRDERKEGITRGNGRGTLP